jgi:hypothetical protein
MYLQRPGRPVDPNALPGVKVLPGFPLTQLHFFEWIRNRDIFRALYLEPAGRHHSLIGQIQDDDGIPENAIGGGQSGISGEFKEIIGGGGV